MIVENVWKLTNTVNELLGISTTSMDFDVSLSKGKPSFKCTCKSNRCPTTDPLMW